MEIKFYVPKSDILKKYIVGYYFLNAAKNASPINYWTFPNNFCILSVNLNSTSTYLDNKINVVLRPCWYSTPILATLLAVVVSIDQQRIALKYFN